MPHNDACAFEKAPDWPEPAELDAVIDEVRSVLDLMDGLAEVWGDEAVFRRCRDRLRKLTDKSE